MNAGLRINRPAIEAACAELDLAESALLHREGARFGVEMQSVSGVDVDVAVLLAGIDSSRRSLLASSGAAGRSLAELLEGVGRVDGVLASASGRGTG